MAPEKIKDLRAICLISYALLDYPPRQHGGARTLAKKRRKVPSEMYRNLAIADFGRPASSMSAISSHSCGVGCQAIRFVPGFARPSIGDSQGAF
jgi:hypothetical protein